MLDSTEQEASPLLNQVEVPLKTGDVCDNSSFKPTSLPGVQLAILCFLRTLDPMSFSQIFPYVNEFISDLHITDDPTRIGFYSGLVESAFAFTQLLSIYPWGVSSDHFGRRPVVLAGVGGLAITTILFGLSSSLPAALLARAGAGLFAGNVTVIPSMLCELTNDKNQASAFSFFGLWWPMGAIVGSLVGGLLSKPATRYTNYFDNAFFKSHPYFLPCLFVSALSTIGFIVSWFFLKETMRNGHARSLPRPPAYGTMVGDQNGRIHKSLTIKELLSMPILRALCTSGLFLSFMSAAFDVLFVLFCFSPIKAGGLSFSASQIGFALSVSGGIGALLQAIVMPTVLNRFNHTSTYHFCMRIWPYLFMSMPLLNVIAKHGLVEETGQSLKTFATTFLWISIALVLAMARVAFLAYTVNVLLIKQFTPNSSSLGTTLSLVQVCICLSRAIAPGFASSAFAISMHYQIFGGYFWVILMTTIGFMSSVFSEKILIESHKLSN